MNLVQEHYFSNVIAPRFSGLIIVVALHLGAVMALMIGLQPKIGGLKLEAFKVKPLEEQKVKVDPPPPPQVVYNPPPIELPQPPIFNAPVDDAIAPYSTPTPERKDPTTTAQKAPSTSAKPTQKGLSAPSYPSESKKLGEEGSVGLALYLNEAGRVQEARVETSSGFPRLDDAAVKHATRSWKFEPCIDDKKPVACWHKIKFRFQLKDA